MPNNTFAYRLRRALRRRQEQKDSADSKTYAYDKNQNTRKEFLLSEHKQGGRKTGQEEPTSQETPSERSVARSTRTIARLTGALVFVSLLSAGISFFQWKEIHDGATDTHDLATAAIRQASAATKQAESLAIVAENARVSAEAARISAVSAQSSVEATDEFNRPRIELFDAKIVKNGEFDPIPHINFIINNVGRSPGTVRFIYVNCSVVVQIPAIPSYEIK